ncbi:MAG: glycosyltransferase [Armatimonadota bacterium]|nr:glycosyltransferase [Armatimonadota bacterium]
MAKILIHTLGSSGDLNPFAALGLELQRRGHDVQFAVSPSHAARLRTLGLDAVDAVMDIDPHTDLMRRLLAASQFEPIRILFQEVLIPDIVPATQALEPLARQADLFLSHSIQLAARAVAHRTGVRWITAAPAPLLFPTGEYPAPGVAWKGFPPALSRLAWSLGARLFAGIDALANAEYAALGVSPALNVINGGAYSRRLTLGLWSPAFFSRPLDWPDWLQVGGYARWDGPSPAASPVPPELGIRGLSSPLILFTLGSSVVNDPRGFWETALEAIAATDWRGVLLGAPPDFPIPSSLQDRVQAIPFAPYGDLFPQADAVVHQGGVGTTQATCFYGIPSVIVPRGFDQFENAAHIQREGWGLRLLPQNLSAAALRFRLERLLRSAEIRRRVGSLGRQMQAEPGASASADHVEAALKP